MTDDTIRTYRRTDHAVVTPVTIGETVKTFLAMQFKIERSNGKIEINKNKK